MSHHFGYCPKCKKMRDLTEHHIYPRRFFGENKSSLYICRDCHDDIELIIPQHDKLSKEAYVNLVTEWLSINCYCAKNRKHLSTK